MNKNKQDFFNDFYSTLKEVMEPMGGHLTCVEFPKNNCIMTGIKVMFDKVPIEPIVIPDSYYENWKNGQTLGLIVFNVKLAIIEGIQNLPDFNISNMNRYSVMAHLYVAVVGYVNNKEWLKDIPHERIADLAAFVKWRLGNAEWGLGVFANITESLLAKLQLSKEEALEIAKANTIKSVKFDDCYYADRGMDGVLPDVMKAGIIHAPFKVLTTEYGNYGAGVIACPEVLTDVRKKVGEDFYILPCSIHEVLILPKSLVDFVEDLKFMVTTINDMAIPLEDRLSNQVYEFDGYSIRVAGVEVTQS